ncbi:hypothetical protein ACFQX7_03320 [Luedemannella flava]
MRQLPGPYDRQTAGRSVVPFTGHLGRDRGCLRRFALFFASSAAFASRPPGVWRSSMYGSASAGRPASMARRRCSSASNSAPSSRATLDSHSQIRNTMTAPTVPYVLL